MRPQGARLSSWHHHRGTPGWTLSRWSRGHQLERTRSHLRAAAGQGLEQGPRAAASTCTTAPPCGRVTPVGQLPRPAGSGEQASGASMRHGRRPAQFPAACSIRQPRWLPDQATCRQSCCHAADGTLSAPASPASCRMPVPWRGAVLLLLLTAAVTGSAAGRQLSASTALRAEAPKAGNRTVSVSAAPVAAIVNGAQGCFWFPSGGIASALSLCRLAVAFAAVAHVPPHCSPPASACMARELLATVCPLRCRVSGPLCRPPCPLYCPQAGPRREAGTDTWLPCGAPMAQLAVPTHTFAEVSQQQQGRGVRQPPRQRAAGWPAASLHGQPATHAGSQPHGGARCLDANGSPMRPGCCRHAHPQECGADGGTCAAGWLAGCWVALLVR